LASIAALYAATSNGIAAPKATTSGESHALFTAPFILALSQAGGFLLRPASFK
jgi:hypothetical protein